MAQASLQITRVAEGATDPGAAARDSFGEGSALRP